MAAQQQFDEFNIYGFLPEAQGKGDIKIEDLNNIICDAIQLVPMFDLIIDIYQKMNDVQLPERSRLDIQKVYSCFEQTEFFRRVPPFMNNRRTKQNVKIIKSAINLYSKQLLTIKEIKDSVFMFQLKELQHMTEGLPCDIKILKQILRQFNKTLSVKVLEEWRKKIIPFLEAKDTIYTHEFLYLVANTVDRKQYFDRIPKSTMDVSRDEKFRLFKVDSSGYHHLKNPDAKIQQYMNYQYNIEKAQYIGLESKEKGEQKMRKETQVESYMKKKKTGESQFQKLLKNPELYVEIKTKLKSSQQQLNQSKLNGSRKMQPELTIDTTTGDGCASLLDVARKHLSTRGNSTQHLREEVELHRKMMGDQGFLSELNLYSMGRATSAKTFQTTGTSMKIKEVPTTSSKGNNYGGIPKMRPITAMTRVEEQKETSKIETILNEQLSNLELERIEGGKEKKNFVFYGSSNQTKRKYNINLPWSAK